MQVQFQNYGLEKVIFVVCKIKNNGIQSRFFAADIFHKNSKLTFLFCDKIIQQFQLCVVLHYLV